MNIKILVIDDEYLVRLGIRETIDWNKYGFSIIGEAGDGRKGLELALHWNPEIILTDIRMPFMDGLEFMNQIRKHGLDSKIVVLTGYAEFNYVKIAMDNGASAYLLKPIENAQLLDTMKQLGREIREQQYQQEYYKKLEKEIPAIEQKFFRDLMTGVLTDNKVIQEKINFFRLPLKENNNVVVLIRMDGYEEFIKDIRQREAQELNHFIGKKIRECLIESRDCHRIMIDDFPGQWVGIFYVSDSLEEIVADVKDKCRFLLPQLEEDVNKTFSIVISGLCMELKDISAGYLEACSAAVHKWMPGISSVIYVNQEKGVLYREEIRDAIEYVKEHFQEDITIDGVAKAIYISSDYLMHLFKSEVGKTFNEYLTGYRIEMAKKYLNNRRYRIYEVCRMVGYKDAKYFSQIFKKITGQLPSEYSKKID